MMIDIIPLHAAIRTEISGIDSYYTLAADTRSALLVALVLHHVQVFPDANITHEHVSPYIRNFSDLQTFPQSDMGAARGKIPSSV